MKVAVTLSSRDFDAALFDLDGVLTRTASVHAAAWKKLFDGFLEQRATKAGTPFVPLDIDSDYTMRIRYRGHSLDLRLTRDSLSIRERDGAAPPITLCVDSQVCEFVSGTTRFFRLNGDATDRGTHET